MTFRLGFFIDADASGAQRAVEGTADRMKRLKSEALGIRSQLAATNAELAKLAAAGTKSGAAVEALRARQVQLRADMARASASIAAQAAAATQLQRANTLAAGSVGNLTAQFNDIGIMMAAGQNPLQLALQQGTQVTQVIGPLGAAGAVRALGTAFLGLLSPVNLVTIAAIAGGAALVQWLSSAEEEAISLEDAVAGLEDSIEAVRDGAATTLDDMIDRFGALTEEVLQLDREMQNIRLRKIFEDANAAARSLGTALDDMGGFFASGIQVLGDAFGMTLGQASQLEAAIRNVGSADSLSGQIAALDRVQELLSAAAGAVETMTAEQAAFYAKTLDVEAVLREAAAAAGEIPGGISAAAGAADGLNANLAVSVGLMRQLAAIQLRSPEENLLRARVQAGLVPPVALPGGGLPGAPTGNVISPIELPALPRISTRGGVGGRSGGGAKTAQAEADAVEKLIDKLQGEVDIVRELDPIQKEMLRYREQLKDATEAERQTVEELIATREREKATAEALAARADLFNDILASSLDALIVRGESLEDVLKNIVAQLAKAAIQAAIFGTGPFGGLFGGSGIGQLIFGVPGKAAGGPITGPGGPTDDRVPIMASNGEFIVNAAATRRHYRLLHAINAGSALPRFATGGMVGAGAATAAAKAPAGPSTMIIDVRGATGNAEVRDMVAKGVQIALMQYDRQVLPRSVRRIADDGRRIG